MNPIAIYPQKTTMQAILNFTRSQSLEIFGHATPHITQEPSLVTLGMHASSLSFSFSMTLAQARQMAAALIEEAAAAEHAVEKVPAQPEEVAA